MHVKVGIGGRKGHKTMNDKKSVFKHILVKSKYVCSNRKSKKIVKLKTYSLSPIF